MHTRHFLRTSFFCVVLISSLAVFAQNDAFNVEQWYGDNIGALAKEQALVKIKKMVRANKLSHAHAVAVIAAYWGKKEVSKFNSELIRKSKGGSHKDSGGNNGDKKKKPPPPPPADLDVRTTICFDLTIGRLTSDIAGAKSRLERALEAASDLYNGYVSYENLTTSTTSVFGGQVLKLCVTIVTTDEFDENVVGGAHADAIASFKDDVISNYNNP